MTGMSFLGIDLGGTQLRAAVVGADGTRLASRRVPTDRAGGVAAVLGQMERLVEDLRRPETRAVGIGVPGAFDAATGTVLDIPALPGWNGVPLASILHERTGLPAVLENDAKVAALGEWRAGAARGLSDFAYVTIGTGIGGAFVVGGRLIRGTGGLAGEVGHTRVADETAVCSCGHRGCWEAVASGSALSRAARRAVERQPGSALARSLAGRPATGADVDRAARDGCPAAMGVLEEEARWLSVGFVNIQHLFAPRRIVIGGSVSNAFDLMAETVARCMDERLLPGHRRPELVRAALGDDAGLVGAAHVAAVAHGGGDVGGLDG